MKYYHNNNFPVEYISNGGNRFFLVPFLTGALAGGAAVGLTRPRPIYNVAPQPSYPPYQVGPYGNFNYSYYYPNNYWRY